MNLMRTNQDLHGNDVKNHAPAIMNCDLLELCDMKTEYESDDVKQSDCSDLSLQLYVQGGDEDAASADQGATLRS